MPTNPWLRFAHVLNTDAPSSYPEADAPHMISPHAPDPKARNSSTAPQDGSDFAPRYAGRNPPAGNASSRSVSGHPRQSTTSTEIGGTTTSRTFKDSAGNATTLNQPKTTTRGRCHNVMRESEQGFNRLHPNSAINRVGGVFTL